VKISLTDLEKNEVLHKISRDRHNFVMAAGHAIGK